jgi:hypothetical protein
MVFSFLYIVLQRLLELVVLRRQAEAQKDLEIIDQGEAGWHLRHEADPERDRSTRGNVVKLPGHCREDAIAQEPPGVRGVAHEDRHPCGRPEDPGWGDGRPYQRVDERRLPRTRRAADHGE